MCGIAGAIGAVDREVIGAVSIANGAQAHRGPDAEGAWQHVDGEGGVAFAHRRLAIIDLSEAGRQPMEDPETGSVICFNGEIYNYRELRAELEALGQHFRTNTDTEVILKAYAAWGEDAVKRLRGMFAFALWNAETRETLLVRDRLGIKPLYVAEVRRGDGRLQLFASEIRSLLTTGLLERRLDRFGVGSYLWNGFVVGPQTIIEGVESLDAGSLRVMGADGTVLRENHYWQLPEPGQGGSLEEFEAVLEEAVRMRLVSDVPLGLFLSGGIDSSAIAALAARNCSAPPRTFTLGFGEAEWDESKYAEAVASAIGTDHTCILLTPETFQDQLGPALDGLDQPTFDAVNSYVVSRAVREAGITVALSGAGGDELFGGYRSFRNLPLAATWSRRLGFLPDEALRSVVRLWSGASSTVGGVPPQTRWGKLADLITTRGRLVDAYQVAYALFTREFLDVLAQPSVGAAATVFGLPFARHAALDALSKRGGTRLHDVSTLELSLFLGERLLRDTDTASMAVGLEVRLPLIDHEVVEAAARLSKADRYAPLGRKQALRSTALADLPRELFERPKMGFVLPFEQWCRGELRPRLAAAFEDREACAAVGLRPDGVWRLWNAFLAGQKGLYWSRIWALFVLIEWARRWKVAL